MLRQELLQADQQLLNASLYTRIGAKSGLKFSHHLLVSSNSSTCNSRDESQSPLHSSEGSTSAATPPECSSSPANFTPPSIWSDYLSGTIPLMSEDNLIPTTSSTTTSAAAWWSSASSSSAANNTNSGSIREQQDLSQQWSNFASQASQASNSMSEMDAGEWQLGCLATAPEVNEQLSKLAIESANNVYSSIGTTLVDAEMSNNPNAWSSILIDSSGGEEPGAAAAAIENATVEGLHEALFAKSLIANSNANPSNSNSNNTSMLKTKAEQDVNPSSSWEFLKTPGSFELDDMNSMNPKLVQFSLASQDAKMEMDTWPVMNEASPSASSSHRIGNYPLDAFADIHKQQHQQHQHFDPIKIKQEFEPFNTSNSSSSSSPMIPTMQHDHHHHHHVTDLLGGGSKPLLDPMNMQHMLNPNEASSSRWGNKFPAMLSQVLPPPVSSAAAMTKQANLFGSSSTGAGVIRPFGNYKQDQQHYKAQREQSSMSSITSQHSYDSKDSHLNSKHMMDEGREVSSSDPKRSLSLDHPQEPFFKRPRIEQQQNTSLPFKATAFVLQVRKEKLGERITALQQLVSPFGKTDTASVLLEAIGYIKFLHEQVQVLSTPYMKNAATGGGTPAIAPSMGRPNEKGSSSSSSSSAAASSWPSDAKPAKEEDQGRQDLRSRGLCLVPISCTMQVTNNDNGADFWTPTIGGNSNSAK